MFKKRKKYVWFIVIFFMVVYVLPNMLNFREQKFFNEQRRLKTARELSAGASGAIEMIPGEYYKRGGLYTWFFGVKNRELWTTPVMFSVLNYDTTKGGLTPYEIGGSQQTISIRLRDSSGKNWVLRSVNKDQQNVLPWWLRPSIIRPVFRDQVSAMNPYGAKVVAHLSASLGLPHLDPQLYWVPYVEKYGDYNERIAGRVVYLEPYIDSTWTHDPRFFNAIHILDTEEMEERITKDNTPIDTLLYLKTRLFDMLISDWDRHQDQWKWALTDIEGKKIYCPVARDRDIAFYVFDEGLINKLALRANPKFQSYREDFGSIKGLMHQSKKLDKKILKGFHKQHFIAMAAAIRTQLDNNKILAAFSQYPPNIYHRFGKQHEAIMQSRLSQLATVAAQFYELVNED